MDLTVCIAHLVLRFYVGAPVQEEGNCLFMAITGRSMEGCKPFLQQQQRYIESSGKARTERNRRTGQGKCGAVRQEIGQGMVG